MSFQNKVKKHEVLLESKLLLKIQYLYLSVDDFKHGVSLATPLFMLVNFRRFRKEHFLYNFSKAGIQNVFKNYIQ